MELTPGMRLAASVVGPVARAVKRKVESYLEPRDEKYEMKKIARKAVSGLARTVDYKKEWHYIDTAINSALDTTGAVNLLNGCTRGDDVSERSGRAVFVQAIELRLVAAATATTGLLQACRVMVFRDKDPQGLVSSIARVLDGSTTQSLRDRDYMKEYQVLKDWHFIIASATGAALTQPYESQRVLTWYRKFKRPIKVEFNSGNAGTAADIEHNAFYLLTLGSQAAGANAGAVVGNARVYFTDA